VKVLHVITGLETGGAERMLASLCLLWAKEGKAPIVVSLTDGGSQYDRLVAADIPVHTLGMRRGMPSLRGLCQLAHIIREHKPDVIQSWMYHADLYALLALALSRRRAMTKLYWGIRCSDMDLRRYGLALRIVVRLCALLSRFPNGIVVNSHAGARVHGRLGYRRRHMAVIENGIDTAVFRPDKAERASVRASLGLADDAFVIGSVARVDVMKDYPGLLSMLDGTDGITCLAVGKGTDGLPATPGLIGLGERNDVPAVLNALDLFVSVSSFGEGFSNAIAEAMATGLPVVATDVGDARHIVGIAGRIVPPKDPDALAKTTLALRGDPQTRRAMGKAGRDRVEREFSLQRCAAAFDDFYAAGQPA
jgi:glycosyltransferase involved in cell wall biosynthesis